MGSITQETQKKIMPHELRFKFGDEVGTEAYKVLRVVDKTEHSIQTVLNALIEADTDERRLKIIDAIWQRYYEKISFFAIGIS